MTKALKFLAVLLFAVPLFAQAQAPRNYSQAELDQMLAPIALYPDALLSQVLMAATYPSEVTEAARWTRANGGLLGDTAVRSAQSEDWDPSVISLVAFPQILQRMDENPEWTRSLGDAFLAQEAQVMDSVQHLRRRAQAAGNLKSSEQIRIEQQGPTLIVHPASPQYVYVPYYDPLVVYGTWWWPAYRPVVWAPWPGYVQAYRPGVSVGFWWGQPVGLSVNFFFGGVDWRYRQVRVLQPAAYYYRAPMIVNRTVVVERNVWRHDPSHRRGVEYRAPEVRQRYTSAAPVHRAQPEGRPQPQVRQEPRKEPREQRPEQRARMPEAVAPQQPRAQRSEPRQEKREERQEPRDERQERGGKGKDRS